MSKDWLPFLIMVGMIILWACTTGREKSDDKELVQFYAKKRRK